MRNPKTGYLAHDDICSPLRHPRPVLHEHPYPVDGQEVLVRQLQPESVGKNTPGLARHISDTALEEGPVADLWWRPMMVTSLKGSCVGGPKRAASAAEVVGAVCSVFAGEPRRK